MPLKYKPYDLEHETSLHKALRLHESDETILKSLVDLEPNSSDVNEALNFAVCRSTTAIAQKLIQLGADLNHTNGNGWTPLHSAIDASNLEAVCMLLYHNVDVSICCDNWCPLFRAIYYKRYAIVDVLVDYCFDEPACGDALRLMRLIDVRFAFNLKFKNYIQLPDVVRWGDVCYFLCEMCDTAEMFQRLCPLITAANCVSVTALLIMCTTESRYDANEINDCTYALLSSPVGKEIVDRYNRSIKGFAPKFYVFSNYLYSPYHEIDETQDESFFYIYLSFGIEVSLRDIVDVYHSCGYGGELEALISAGKIYWDVHKMAELYPMLPFVLFRRWTYSTKRLEHFLNNSNNAYKKEAAKYFNLKTQIDYNYNKDSARRNDLARMFARRSSVPKLIELCRDQVRRTFIFTRRYSKPYQYVHAVRKLCLPKMIRDIVLFKKPIY